MSHLTLTNTHQFKCALYLQEFSGLHLAATLHFFLALSLQIQAPDKSSNLISQEMDAVALLLRQFVGMPALWFDFGELTSDNNTDKLAYEGSGSPLSHMFCLFGWLVFAQESSYFGETDMKQ